MGFIPCELCGVMIESKRVTRKKCRACRARSYYEKKKGKEYNPALKDVESVGKKSKPAQDALYRLKAIATDEALIYALDALWFFAESLGWKFNQRKNEWEQTR